MVSAMRRRVNRAWITAALALIGAIIAGEREVQAAPVGIIIKTGVTQPVGDPFFEYVFDIQLLAGSTLENGGFITVYDMPLISDSSLTQQPNAKWGSSLQLTGVTPMPPESALDRRRPEYLECDLGVEREPDHSTGGPQYGPGLLRYRADRSIGVASPALRGLPGWRERVEPGVDQVNIVPEPSSVALLLTGAGTLALLARRKRRPRAVPSA